MLDTLSYPPLFSEEMERSIYEILNGIVSKRGQETSLYVCVNSVIVLVVSNY